MNGPGLAAEAELAGQNVVPRDVDRAPAVSAEKLRAWAFKSVFALVDQALTSAAGFGVNLLLARWMAPEAYGAFAVAFAGFLFVSGFHNVLLLEPLSVFGPSRHAETLPGYFRAQIAVHALLTGTLSAVTLLGSLVLWRMAPGSPLTRAVLGGSLALPFLLYFWLVRRMCYVVQRPSAAVVGSGFYFAFVVAGLFAMGRLGWLGLFTAFSLMGCGSVLAACLLLWRLGLLKGKPGFEGGVRWRAALRENWTYGRWLVGSAILHSVSTQVHMFLVAALLGLNAAGVLRAMQLPSLVVAQVITAAGLLVLPALSYDYGHRRFEALRYKARLVSFGLAACALAFAAGLGAFSPRTEHLLFGGKYAGHAWLMPLLALVPAANSLSMGYSMALRAARKPQFDLMANAIAAPTAALAGFLLIRWWGLGGAATSVVLSFAVLSAVSLIFYRRTAFGVAEVLPREVR